MSSRHELKNVIHDMVHVLIIYGNGMPFMCELFIIAGESGGSGDFSLIYSLLSTTVD